MKQIKIHRRRMQGIIVSDKMQKTVVVEVTRVKEHPKYKKRFKATKRYKAHNPENKYHAGDKVIIQECRPLSKGKRWIIVEKSPNLKHQIPNNIQ